MLPYSKKQKMDESNHSVITVYPKNEQRNNHKFKNTSLFLSKIPKNQILQESDASFYKASKFVLTLAQLFALLPVNGIRKNDISYLRFKWLSWKMLYSILIISGSIITTVLYIVECVNNEKQFTTIEREKLEFSVNMIFFLSCAISGILFINLSRKWYSLNEKWLHVEYMMRNYPFPPNLTRRFKITTFVVMLCALVEHLLSLINHIQQSKRCPSSKVDPVKAYFGVTFSNVFSLFDYHPVLAFIMEVIIIIATFTWNFSDLFVMLQCAAVALRFKQLNKKVAYDENKNEQFWKEVREDYTRLSCLCKTLDKAICHIVTLSFGNNLFFICVQLFHTLTPLKGLTSTIYFLGSFGFLLGRTAALSIYCCWINDESKNILVHLFEIPSDEFGSEASRLIQQISFSPVAITGSNYFQVTRGLCLQVAGAVITFELILVQLGPVLLKTDKEEYIFCIK